MKALPLLCFWLCLLGGPALSEEPDTNDYDTVTAATTNHQSKVLRESGFKNYPQGQIDFELLDLTTNALDEDPDYPPELEALDGKTVEFVGFMTPYDSIEEFKRFMLVNFPTGCNFCAIPRLQEIVFVQVDLAKKPPPFIEGITKVRGTIHLKKPGRAFEIEGWLPDERHNVFKEFIFVISDAKASKFDPEKDKRQASSNPSGEGLPKAAASSARSGKPPWFYPAVAGVLLVSLLFGLSVYRKTPPK